MDVISQQSPFQTLPDELKIRIFGYLSPSELSTAMRVHSSWKAVADDQELWKVQALQLAEVDVSFQRRFSDKETIDWKEEVKNYHSISGNIDLFVQLCQRISEIQNLLTYDLWRPCKVSSGEEEKLQVERKELEGRLQKIDVALEEKLGQKFLSSIQHLQYFLKGHSLASAPCHETMFNFRSIRLDLEAFSPCSPLLTIKTTHGPGIALRYTNEERLQKVIAIVPYGKVNFQLQINRIFGLTKHLFRDFYNLGVNPQSFTLLCKILSGEPVDLGFAKPFYLA